MTYIYAVLLAIIVFLVIALKFYMNDRDRALLQLNDAKQEISAMYALDSVEDAVFKAQTESRNEAAHYEEQILEGVLDEHSLYGDPRLTDLMHEDANSVRTP